MSTPLDDAVLAVIKRLIDEGDAATGQSFMAHYRQMFPELADPAVGWLCGELGQDDMVKGLRFFGIHHPYFGDADHAERMTAQMRLAIVEYYADEIRKLTQAPPPPPFTGGTLSRW